MVLPTKKEIIKDRKYSLKDRLKLAADRFFWNTYELSKSKQETLLHEGVKLFEHASLDFEERSIREYLGGLNAMDDFEYLIKIEDSIYFDPNFGWAIKDGKIIKESMPRCEVMAYPSISSYLKMKSGSEKVIEVKKLLSFRDNAEGNYFHFFAWVLNRLWVMEENNELSDDLNILVSEKIYATTYFQFFLKHSILKKHKIIVQTNQWVKAELAYFVQPHGYKPKYWENINQLIQKSLNSSFVAPKRVFLTRGGSDNRQLVNKVEVEALIRKYDFITIDTAGLTTEVQFFYFQKVEYLLAIHGAGMTNIVANENFSKVRVLEIMPKDRIASHFYWLSNTLGFDYHNICLGSDQDQNLNFVVDTAKLEEEIQKLLKV